MRVFLAILLLCASAWTADSPAQDLFNKAREKVLTNIAKVPRYTCVETISRRQQHPQYGVKPKSCPALVAARASIASPPLLLWRDRLRLDVAVVDGAEIFSWAGASKFETNDIQSLAMSGSTGSGAFSTFLGSVFGNDPDHFRYAGMQDGMGVYDYSVPQTRSHYTYQMNSGRARIIAYRGRFYVSAANAELKRLVVEADDFPEGEVCRVEDRMDYRTAKIGSSEFMLPELSTMHVLFESGEESVNETRFSGCHEYVGESSIRFEGEDTPEPAVVAAKAALRALPAKSRVRVRLETPIDSDRSAAGDAVTAVVDRDSEAVRKGDRLHGRVLRLEQFMLPYPHWVIGIRFEAIEREGVEQSVTFLPVDDGDRTPTANYGRVRKVPLPKGPKGAGMFNFDSAGKLLLDEKFRSEWEVAK